MIPVTWSLAAAEPDARIDCMAADASNHLTAEFDMLTALTGNRRLAVSMIRSAGERAAIKLRVWAEQVEKTL